MKSTTEQAARRRRNKVATLQTERDRTDGDKGAVEAELERFQSVPVGRACLSLEEA